MPYRCHLRRTWGPGRRTLWILHSPSRADDQRDDPTLRRCLRFSRAWGDGGLDLLNLFAWRATDPTEVVTAAAAGHDVVAPGPRDAWLSQLAPVAARVVVAWGSLPRPSPEDQAVLAHLGAAGVAPLCLGRTRAGDPRHPLYVAGRVAPVPFWGP